MRWVRGNPSRTWPVEREFGRVAEVSGGLREPLELITDEALAGDSEADTDATTITIYNGIGIAGRVSISGALLLDQRGGQLV